MENDAPDTILLVRVDHLEQNGLVEKVDGLHMAELSDEELGQLLNDCIDERTRRRIRSSI